eukprot:COSAG02_NODE_31802_length_527_cov_0.733645_1_plen_91_part_01
MICQERLPADALAANLPAQELGAAALTATAACSFGASLRCSFWILASETTAVFWLGIDVPTGVLPQPSMPPPARFFKQKTAYEMESRDWSS